MSSVVSEFFALMDAPCLAEGKARGIVRGYRVYLLRQLRRRFGHEVDDDTIWRLGEADSEQLLRWSCRVLKEPTLAEVLLDEPW
jgi:hypothetical protein